MTTKRKKGEESEKSKMKFDHPDYKGVSFKISDKWTVREVLDYDSWIDSSLGDSTYVRLWNAVRSVIQPDDWDCDISLEMSLDDVLDKKALEIIKWAGLAGYSARASMDVDEKN